MTRQEHILLGWHIAISVISWLLFGLDKWKAGRRAWRVPEFQLVLSAALGGWPGGITAMLMFRHKTVKRSFQLKYAAGCLVHIGLLVLWFRHR